MKFAFNSTFWRRFVLGTALVGLVLSTWGPSVVRQFGWLQVGSIGLLILSVVWLVVELGGSVIGKGFRRAGRKAKKQKRLDRAREVLTTLNFREAGKEGLFEGKIEGYRIRIDLDVCDLSLRWRRCFGETRWLAATYVLEEAYPELRKSSVSGQLKTCLVPKNLKGDTESVFGQPVDELFERVNGLQDLSIDEFGIICFYSESLPTGGGELEELVDEIVRTAEEIENALIAIGLEEANRP